MPLCYLYILYKSKKYFNVKVSIKKSEIVVIAFILKICNNSFPYLGIKYLFKNSATRIQDKIYPFFYYKNLHFINETRIITNIPNRLTPCW